MKNINPNQILAKKKVKYKIKNKIAMYSLVFIGLLLLEITPVFYSFGQITLTPSQNNKNSNLGSNELPNSALSTTDFQTNPREPIEAFNKSEFINTPNYNFEVYSQGNNFYDNFPGFESHVSDNFSVFVGNGDPAPVEGNNALYNTMSNTQDSYTYLTQYQYLSPSASIDENLTFSFNWYLNNSAPFQNYTEAYYVAVNFNNSHSINYLLTGYMGSSTNHKYINTSNHDNFKTWNFEFYNLTEAYSAAFSEAPVNVGIISLYITYRLFFESDSIFCAFDNFSINENGTERLLNPGFEAIDTDGTPSNWYGNYYSPSYSKNVKDSVVPSRIAKPTLNSEDKGNAVNLTLKLNNSTYSKESSIYLDKYYSQNHYELTLNSSALFSIDIKPQKLKYASHFSTYILIGMRNLTNYQYYYIMIQNSSSVSNSSNNIYFMMNNLQFDSWNHLEFDLIDLLPLFYSSALNLSYIEIGHIMSGTNKEQNALLIDNFNVIMKFEDNTGFEYPGNEKGMIRRWQSSSLKSYYSSDSHGGAYAMKIINPGNRQDNCRNMEYEIGLETFGKETSIELYYKIPSFYANNSNDRIIMYFTFIYLNGTTLGTIRYPLAYTSSLYTTNSSTDMYYLTNEANTTGQWIRFYRNLYWDLMKMSNVKDPDQIMLTDITFELYSYTAQPIEILVDDIAFGTGIPFAESLAADKSEISYDDSLTITADLYDNGEGFDNITLFYSTNGTWVNKNMIEIDALAQIYQATIPKEEIFYNDTVSYYIYAADKLGNSLTYPSGGVPNAAKLTALDKIKPEILLVNVSNTEISEGSSFNVSIKVTDFINNSESGIKSVTLYISADKGLNWSNYSVPLMSTNALDHSQLHKIEINSTLPKNSFYMLYVRCEDKAGNYAIDNNEGIFYFVTITPKYSDLMWMLFGAGALLGLYIVIKSVIGVRRIKKRKSKRENIGQISTVSSGSNIHSSDDQLKKNQKPSATKRAKSSKTQPTTSEKRSDSSKKRPVSTKERSDSSKKQPSSTKKRSDSSKKQPSSTKK